MGAGEAYPVGRKGKNVVESTLSLTQNIESDCKIYLPNDKSISRKHATIEISEIKSNSITTLNYRPKIAVQDLSKYGTFLNGVRVEAKKMITLNEGDKIKFGIYKNEFVYESHTTICNPVLA